MPDKPSTPNGEPPPRPVPPETTTCPACGETHDLAKIKGCIRCLRCGFKFDCNGW